MTSELKLMGKPINRVDGRQKVTGTAMYAAEVDLAGMTYAVLVDSSIPSGKIMKMDTAEAESAPGVRLVLTHENRGKLGKVANDMVTSVSDEPRPPLEDEKILRAGQFVAMVVANTLEEARYAAGLIRIEYETAPFVVNMDEARETAFKPSKAQGENMQIHRGNVTKGLADADAGVDVTYRTPNEHPCALEPHATVASWSGETLTVYNATQWVLGDKGALCESLGLSPKQVRVLAPYVGGMFGSKAATPGHTILAALASMRLGVPVKTVLSRQQVLTSVGHRTETVQRFEIGAKSDGTLTAMRHHATTHTSINTSKSDFFEPVTLTSRMLYSVPNYEAIHEVVRLNTAKPSWMRAPGEAPCQFALESALDELAYNLRMDPIDLRRRNHASEHAQLGLPFSSKHLLECYDRGSERFGWGHRHPEPKSMRDGKWLVGYGMATATYPGYRFGATVKVRLERDREGVHAFVSTAGSDVGTGMYTMMTIAAAEGLGLPIESVTAVLGDTDLTYCTFAGGSNLTASTAPFIVDACMEIRKNLLALAKSIGNGFEDAEKHIDDYEFSGGRITRRSTPWQSVSYADLLALSEKGHLEAEMKSAPIQGHDKKFAYQSFGASFVEVRVRPDTGQVKVSRVTNVFDCGRIISGKTARSQFIGGITFGIGMALLEELVYDEHGQAINANLADYLVPVNADVPEIDVSWIDEPDLNFNSIGCRGVGEIGITGVAAAIANAVFHATGVRIRDLPITPDKVLGLR